MSDLVQYHRGFMECDNCRIKPGAPILCGACLQNRDVIERQAKEIAQLRPDAERYKSWRAMAIEGVACLSMGQATTEAEFDAAIDAQRAGERK